MSISKWKLVPHSAYPGMVVIEGTAFPVTIVLDAMDITLDDKIKRLSDANKMAAAEDLLAALEECLPCLGWQHMPDEEIRREHELGNGYAEIILRARAAIQKAKAHHDER